MEAQINFSYNWNNKLNCNSFTTIRLEDNEKYIIGKLYQILLNKTINSDANIISIKSFYLTQLNDFIAYIDTGYNKEECTKIMKTMYKNVNFQTKKLSFILLLKTKSWQVKETKASQKSISRIHNIDELYSTELL